MLATHIKNEDDAFSKAEDTNIFVSVNPDDDDAILADETLKMSSALQKIVRTSVDDKDVESWQEFFVLSEKAIRNKGGKIGDYFGMASYNLAACVTMMSEWQRFASRFKEDTGLMPPIMVMALKKGLGDGDTIQQKYGFLCHYSLRRNYEVEGMLTYINNEISYMISSLLASYGCEKVSSQEFTSEVEDGNVSFKDIDFIANSDERYEA